MAYESLLNVPVQFQTITQASATSGASTQGFDATFTLQTSGTTLGSNLGNVVFQVALITDIASGGTSLSASAAGSTVVGTLTSVNFPTQTYNGTIAGGSTFNGVTSAAACTLTFFGPNLETTSISLTATGSTLGLDSVKPSALDNFFYYITNPEPAKDRGVRTTADHARRVAYFG
jgi:hypothetical protein